MKQIYFTVALITGLFFSGCADTSNLGELRDHFATVGLRGNVESDEQLVRSLAHFQRQQPKIDFYRHHRIARPLEVAQRYLEDGMRVRDNPAIHPKPPIDWAANPRNDRNWLFQKNATYVLAPFMQAHAETGGKAHLETAKAVLLDWIDYNLYQNKDNSFKWYDMAAGLRAVNMAYVTDAELRSDQPDVETVKKFIRALIAHAAELADPTKLAAGNHAYFQLVGLVAICKALPLLTRCPEFEEYAVYEMDKLIARQFTREGIQREHSPEYHFYSLARADRILATNWFEISEDSKRRIRLARENGAWFRHPDGTISMIGDSSRGRPKPKAFNAVVRAGAHDAFGRVFPQSGYAMLRSPWFERPANKHSYLIFWAGEERPGETERHSYGHSHEDNFTFEWSEFGVPVLVDSGKYSYQEDAWRDYFVSTRAHNTVEIDDTDYSNRSQSPYLPGIVDTDSGGALQHIHAFIHHEQIGVGHRRILVMNSGRWLAVVDILTGSRAHKYTQWFHFHEDWQIEERVGVLLGHHPNGALRVQNVSSEPATLQFIRGDTEPRIQGWISPSYLQRVDNAAIGFTSHGRHAEFLTLFVWGKGTDPLDIKRFSLEGDEVNVCWADGRTADGFRYRSGKTMRATGCAE